jgi:hypothetical protein
MNFNWQEGDRGHLYYAPSSELPVFQAVIASLASGEGTLNWESVGLGPAYVTFPSLFPCLGLSVPSVAGN